MFDLPQVIPGRALVKIECGGLEYFRELAVRSGRKNLLDVTLPGPAPAGRTSDEHQ